MSRRCSPIPPLAAPITAVLISSLLATWLALGGDSTVAAWTSWSLDGGGVSSGAGATSDHLVVSELTTGGASASDEFVEIYNPSSAPLPLEGLELVYVSASGATITRKAAWSNGAAQVPPGAHVLVANEAGIYAPAADHLYANGLAAAGGSVALRLQGAATAIDAVGWGSASSTWLEGAPAPAPAAGASLERLPGGALGSGEDSDDNLTDFVERAEPDPQSSSSPPIPLSTPDPTPSAAPSQTPMPPAPTPTPTAVPTPSPSPSPLPTILAVSVARTLPDGATATVQGAALTDGTFSDGGGYLQDATGGIAVLVSDGTFPRGALLRVTGQLDDRYHQRTLRTTAAGVEVLGPALDPEPASLPTGSIGEEHEAVLVRIQAVVTSSASQLSSGVAFDVDDGSGPTRLVVYLATGIDSSQISRGLVVDLVGVVGQRDSGGTGAAGYRVQPRDDADLVSVAPPATPQPSGSGDATPAASASPSPTPVAEGVIPISDARQAAINARVRVQGVVTLPSSVLGDGTAAIQDASGAIIVRLGDEAGVLELGDVVVIDGTRSTKSGMETVRTSLPPQRLGRGGQPQPALRSTGAVAERDEAVLVTVSGFVTSTPRRTSAQNAYLDMDDGSGVVRVFVSPRTGISTENIALGSRIEVVGVVGQETTGQQPLRGYRIWPRVGSDVRLTAPPGDAGAAPGPDGGASSGDSGTPSQPSHGGGSPAFGSGGGSETIDLPPPRLVAPPHSARPSPSPSSQGETPVADDGVSGSEARSSLGIALLLVTVLGAVGSVLARRPGFVERLRSSLERLAAAGAERVEQGGSGPGEPPGIVDPYAPASPRLEPLRVVDDHLPSGGTSPLSTTRDHGGRILPPT